MCGCRDEFLHDLAAEVARVLDLAVELAVAEGAGAAFAELHVRLRIELVLAPQAPGVSGALAHGLATFQNDGPKTHLRQHQSGKDAAGAEADDHRAYRCLAVRQAHRLPLHVGSGRDVRILAMSRQQRRLLGRIGQADVHDVDGQQVDLAGIEAAFEHFQAGQFGLLKPERRGSEAPQGGLRVGWWQAVLVGFRLCIGGAGRVDRQGGQGEFEFGQADHGGLVARVDQA